MTIGTELDALLASIQGAPGPQGIPGPAGATGDPGPQGPAGPAPDLTAINAAILDLQNRVTALEAPAPPFTLDLTGFEEGIANLQAIFPTLTPTDLANLQGLVKQITPAPAPAPTPAPAPVWTTVAQQHQGFTLAAQSTVRYGEVATNRFFTKTLPAGNYTCDNTQFGDPAPGVDAKICQVQS